MYFVIAVGLGVGVDEIVVHGRFGGRYEFRRGEGNGLVSFPMVEN